MPIFLFIIFNLGLIIRPWRKHEINKSKRLLISVFGWLAIILPSYQMAQYNINKSPESHDIDGLINVGYYLGTYLGVLLCARLYFLLLRFCYRIILRIEGRQ